MESHPIPQQISSYQFRLVGDMTLKQFFQIAGGALIALLIYSTGLHPIIKWPLILLSAGTGVALAFLPFQERPLSSWMLSFFRSIYSPTIYTWKQSDKPITFFAEEDKNTISSSNVALSSATVTPASQANLEKNENTFLSKIAEMFSSLTNMPATPQKEIPTKLDVQNINTQTATIKTVSIPAPQPISFSNSQPSDKQVRPKFIVEENVASTTNSNVSVIQNITPVLPGNQSVQGNNVTFSESAAPPHPPSIPNTVSGQVLGADGKIVDGAILEIRDAAGRPVRALRSNKLGHFLIVTALANGLYEVVTEKEGYIFDPVTFDAKGEIIPPILIKARVGIKNETNGNLASKPLIIN